MARTGGTETVRSFVLQRRRVSSCLLYLKDGLALR
jgi:hypothetical protein